MHLNSLAFIRASSNYFQYNTNSAFALTITCKFAPRHTSKLAVYKKQTTIHCFLLLLSSSQRKIWAGRDSKHLNERDSRFAKGRANKIGKWRELQRESFAREDAKLKKSSRESDKSKGDHES